MHICPCTSGICEQVKGMCSFECSNQMQKTLTDAISMINHFLDSSISDATILGLCNYNMKSFLCRALEFYFVKNSLTLSSKFLSCRKYCQANFFLVE